MKANPARAEYAKKMQRVSNVKTEKRRSGRAPKALVIIMSLIACLAVLVIAFGFYVNSIKTVYPNVSIAGVDVSGMTYDEALQALINAGYEDNAADVSATINFPNGLEMVIVGEDAGLALDAGDAARIAVNYGKDGSFFACELNYLKALLNKAELTPDSLAEVDSDYVAAVATEYTKKFNESLMGESLAIKDDRIEIVKSTGMAIANVDDVIALAESLLLEALEARSGLRADYVPTGGSESEDTDLVALYNMINVDPVSATLDKETWEVSDSVTGVSFDMDSARRMLDNAQSGDRIVIPLLFTEPEVTKDELSSMLFRDVLSEKTTDIAGTSNRLNNIVISSGAINGLVMYPGDEFSFNEVVGIRTTARGYKEAGAYVGGRTVQEVGGGICQTSSTLYYCVLYADLEVVSRSCHMFTVPYLPLGHDATVSWGSIDFKFKNDTDFPIRLEANVEGRNLTFKIIGTKTNGNYVKTEFITLRTIDYETVKVEDESIEPGTSKVDTDGHKGSVVETYKYIYDENDNLISKTLISTSTYRKQDRVVLVPVGTLNPTEEPPTDSPSPDSTTSPPPDTIPSDSPPPDTIPSDSPPPDTIPSDSPPPDTIPTDSPPDTIPSDSPPDVAPEE